MRTFKIYSQEFLNIQYSIIVEHGHHTAMLNFISYDLIVL